jgi:hypothetical protein
MLAMNFPKTILGEAYLLAIFAALCLIMPPPVGAYVAILMLLATVIMNPEIPSEFFRAVGSIYGYLNSPAALGATALTAGGGYLLAK